MSLFVKIYNEEDMLWALNMINILNEKECVIVRFVHFGVISVVDEALFWYLKTYTLFHVRIISPPAVNQFTSAIAYASPSRTRSKHFTLAWNRFVTCRQISVLYNVYRLGHKGRLKRETVIRHRQGYSRSPNTSVVMCDAQ